VRPVIELERYGFAAHHGEHFGMEHSHRHNEVELNFIEQGAMTYFVAGAEITVHAHKLALFWAAIPHQVIRWNVPTTFFWVTIPLGNFLQWELPAKFTRLLLHGKLLIDSAPDNPDMDHSLFRQWHHDLRSADVDVKRITLLEVEARIRRFGQKLEAEPANTAAAIRPGGEGHYPMAARMAQFISDHFQESLHVRQVANTVNLHPNYAMKVFKAAFGVSIVEYITQHRISFAQRLLVTHDDTILNIAMEAGFGSLSQFYAAFERLCGQSPGHYRAELQRSRVQHPPLP
jgi:AraC-like DNA-binding protein